MIQKKLGITYDTKEAWHALHWITYDTKEAGHALHCIDTKEAWHLHWITYDTKEA